MALPTDREDCDPAFEHFPDDSIPEIVLDDITIRVIIGSAFGKTSPVPVHSDMLYLEVRMPQQRQLTLPDDVNELGVYIVNGSIDVDACQYKEGEMLVAAVGEPLTLTAQSDCRVMVIGGESVGERYVWWNFVSSSRSRIEEAKKLWESGGFKRIEGDPEYIPLPGLRQR